MLGIVNGTTNYILDEMTTKGLDFDDVLKDAQAKGYAEADPTGDIEGYDAANKAAIMATLGFHTNVTIDDVSVEASPRSPPTILLPQPPKTRSSSCWPWWRMARPACLPACIRR